MSSRGAVGSRGSILVLLFPALVAGVTILAFLPALRNGFVDWDDRENFLQNPAYRGLGPSQLLWMFTTFLKGPYQPLSWMTLGLDYIVWGMNPFGYHLTNVLLHAATAACFYFVALRLIVMASGSPTPAAGLPARIGACFAALLFAVHPLRVESVAWVTERRDVLSGLLFALTLLAYLRATAPKSVPRGAGHAAAIFFYTLSLLSKAIGMALPLVLIVLDVYPLKRLPADPRRWRSGEARKVLYEKIPYLALAVLAALVAFAGQSQVKALEGARAYGLVARLGVPVYALAFYLLKTVWPFGLSPLYALPDAPAQLAGWFALSGLVIATLAAVLWRLRRALPGALAAGAAYVALLLPVLGIIQFGAHLAADRYTYLPSMGLAVLAGGALAWTAAGRTRRVVKLVAAPVLGAALLVTTFGALTWAQAQVWRDSETLWRHAEQLDPGAPAIRNYLGLALAANGKPVEAIEQYKEAVRLRPDYAQAHVNWGVALALRGAYEPAIEQYTQAAQIAGDSAEAHHNWGIALARLGRPEEAIARLEEALRIEPRLPGSRSTLAALLLDRGRTGRALEALETLVAYEAPEGEFSDRLAWTLQGKEFDRAAHVIEDAQRRYPNAESPRLSLALVRIRQERLADAAALYGEALTADSGCRRAYQNLSNLCLQAGLYARALAMAQAGLARSPADPILLHNAQKAEEALRERGTGIPRWNVLRHAGTASPEVLLRLAAAGVEEGRSDDALMASAEALKARPGFPEAAWVRLIAEGRAQDPRVLVSPGRSRGR